MFVWRREINFMFTWWIFVVQTCKGQKKAYRGMPWLTNPKNLLAFAASQKKTFGFSDQKVRKRSEISNFAQGKLWFCLPDWIFPKYIIYHKWLLKIFFCFAKVIKLIYLETLCLHPKKCGDQSFFTTAGTANRPSQKTLKKCRLSLFSQEFLKTLTWRRTMLGVKFLMCCSALRLKPKVNLV